MLIADWRLAAFALLSNTSESVETFHGTKLTMHAAIAWAAFSDHHSGLCKGAAGEAGAAAWFHPTPVLKFTTGGGTGTQLR